MLSRLRTGTRHQMTKATDIDLRVEHTVEDADEATSADESGKFSTQSEPGPITQITDEIIDRAWADVCARAHPAARISAFKGCAATRSLLRSILRNGQLDPGKKTASGNPVHPWSK